MSWATRAVVAGGGLVAGALLGVTLGWHAAVIWFRMQAQTGVTDRRFARRTRVGR